VEVLPDGTLAKHKRVEAGGSPVCPGSGHPVSSYSTKHDPALRANFDVFVELKNPGDLYRAADLISDLGYSNVNTSPKALKVHAPSSAASAIRQALQGAGIGTWEVSAMSRFATFDSARGPDGKIRTGVWDRICVPGHDEKDGQSTDFDLSTLSQMAENFARRGDPIPIDHNHQSNYASKNGQPARALGWYGALSVVWGGQVVMTTEAKGVSARAYGSPDVSKGDGLYGLRTEVTEFGHEILADFKLLSPTFTPGGADRDGTPCGYVLAAVAATNTPWQAGTSITFENDIRADILMAKGDLTQTNVYVLQKWVESGQPQRVEATDLPHLRRCLAAGAIVSVGGKLQADAEKCRELGVKMEVQEMAASPDEIAAAKAELKKAGLAICRCGQPVAVRNGRFEWHKNPNGRGSCSASGIPAESYMSRNLAGAGPKLRALLDKIVSTHGAIGAPRTEQGATMAKLAKLAKWVGMSADAPDEDIKKGVEAKMADEASAAMGADESFPYNDHATQLEDAARAYEDAHMEDDGEPPYVGMRKMAAKFRKLGKMAAPAAEPAAPHAEPDGDEKLENEKKEMARQFAQRLGVNLGSNLSSAQMFEALSATAVPTSQLPSLIDAQVSKRLAERDAAAARVTNEQKARALVSMAIEGGYPQDKEAGLLRAASDPQLFDAIAASVEPYTRQAAAANPALFEQQTFGGTPRGATAGRTPASAGGLDRRIIENELATFIEDGGRFSAMAEAMADSRDPVVMAKVDALLSESEVSHPGLRLMAANRVLKQERPDLWDAAERPQLFQAF